MNLKVKGIYFVCLTLLFLVSSVSGCGEGGESTTPKEYLQPPGNLNAHPIYKNYDFYDNPADPTVIRIGIQPLYLPSNLFAAVMRRDRQLQKALRQYQLSIRFYPFLKGNDVNFFLKSRHLHGGMGGDMPTLSIAASIDVIVPAMVQQGYTSLMATQSMLLRDLKGKRIAYAFGSIAHFALLKALESTGLEERDAQLLPMEITDMPDALAAGKIDLFSAWEPATAITIKKIPHGETVFRNLNSGYFYFLRPFFQQHPEAVGHIIAAVIRALSWMQTNKQNLLQACRWALADIKAFTDSPMPLSPKELAKLAQDDILGVCKLPLVPIDFLQEKNILHNEFLFLKNLEKIPRNIKWGRIRDSFDRNIILNILSQPSLYHLEVFDYNFKTNNSNQKRSP